MRLTRSRSRLCAGTDTVRKIVMSYFQAVPHTLGVGAQITRLLSKAHELRNLAEYEGHFDVDTRFLADLLSAVAQLEANVTGLGPVTAG
jgi:hypothetical protein